MATEKPKILFVAADDVIERIEKFRYANHIPSRSETIRILVEAGLKGKPKIFKENK